MELLHLFVAKPPIATVGDQPVGILKELTAIKKRKRVGKP
jgi:hypothetical protein